MGERRPPASYGTLTIGVVAPLVDRRTSVS